jgi:hypothetical protein
LLNWLAACILQKVEKRKNPENYKLSASEVKVIVAMRHLADLWLTETLYNILIVYFPFML